MADGVLYYRKEIGPMGVIKVTPPFDFEGSIISGIGDGVDPGDAVNKGQLDAAVGGAFGIRGGLVKLDGDGKARVVFQEDTPAQIAGTTAGPYDLTGVGNGGTIIVNSDGGGAETVTVNFAAGKHVGGTDESTDMTLEVDTKLVISVDDDDPEEVTFAWAGCNTGNLIAAQMQTAIRALGGNKTLVTVGHDGTKYTITSPTLGTASKIRITRADDHDCCDELDIGPGNGTDTDGTGDVADASAALTTEIADLINTDLAAESIEASEDATHHLVLTSKTAGSGSTLVMGNSTLKTVIGIPDATKDYGSQGLGYASDMPNATYAVVATLKDLAQASLAGTGLAITNIAASGFVVECEKNTSSDYVSVMALDY